MQLTQQDIHQALEAGEIVPYFQPIVDLRAGKIHGFEILARWHHPTHGFIPPNLFIPAVEHHGLINGLSASLLHQAFAAVRALPRDFGLSINLSPSQLLDRAMPDLIHHLAGEAEFDLSRLTVELTETSLVDDLEVAGSVTADLKRLGIRLALDDFGTGYASLLYLQSLPFDELKLDITFVRSMVHSRQSRKIAAAAVNLGLSLGLQTVAEGIEEPKQANLLVWQGCNLGQGHLYGHPIPAAHLLDTLSRVRPSIGVGAEVPASHADPFFALDAQPTERLSQLRAIYDSAPVGLAFVNTSLRYVNLNQRLAQMNGKSVHDHLGRTVSDMVAPELFAQFEPYLRRALSGESFPSIEVRKASANQPATTLMLSYQPVQDEAGEVLGVCISITDISALKQKEEALRESEDHYRHAVELNPQIPWVMDPEGNNISVSTRWESVTGLTQERTKNYGWLDAVHPEDRERVLATLQSSLRSGTPIDLEYRVSSDEKTWIWMRSRGAARRDASGAIVRWYGSVESIDDHKRALDELRGSEARLRAIFDAAPAGIILVESDTGKVLSANPRAERLIGFQFKTGMVWSAEGWKAFNASGQPIDGSDLPLMRAMRLRETTDAEEVLLHRPDGSKIWLSLTAAPVCLENGTQLGGVLVVQDIYTGKRECERLIEHARELAIVASRTAEIYHYPVS